MDELLAAVVTLCRKCLAPMHRGRTIEHRGVRIPTLQCSGRHLDLEAARALIPEGGILSDQALRSVVLSDVRQVHEVNIAHAAVIDGILKEQVPMRERAQMYLDDPTLVKNIIADGCEKARELARETMRDVREAMGLEYH